MEPLAPDMQSLFAQLGEPDDEASIARFIEKNGCMRGYTKLHEAPFWSSAQAGFLRDAIAQDANWAPVVDSLNARLHTAGLPASARVSRAAHSPRTSRAQGASRKEETPFVPSSAPAPEPLPELLHELLPEPSPEIAPERSAAAAAIVRAAPPVLVGSMASVTQSRLVRVAGHTLLAAVAAVLLKASIDMVVVCDPAGAAEGVITETVLIRQLAFGHANVFQTRASEVMLRNFSCCQAADALTDVLVRMQASSLAYLLVVEGAQVPLGVLNVRDGLRALLAAGTYEEKLLRDYVMGVGYH